MSSVAFRDAALARGFTSVPNDVLVDTGLSVSARMTWMLLAKYAWQKAEAWPSQATLSSLLGVTERSVRSYLRELQERGWLEPQQRGLGKTNVYLLLIPLTGSVDPVGPEADCRSDRKQASAKEDSVVKNTQEKKKRASKSRVLSPAEEPIGFSEWLGHHVSVSGGSAPRAGTTYRSTLARTFGDLVAEGYSLAEFKAASAAVCADEFMRSNGHTAPENVLRKSKIGKWIEAAARAKAAEPAEDSWKARNAARLAELSR